jgi:hypothetical protein
LAVKCPDIEVEGKEGPVHILDYRNMAKGQDIRFYGLLNAECVPIGTVARVMKNAMMNGEMSAAQQAMTLLYFLYNTTTDDNNQEHLYKCSWTYTDYKERVCKWLPSWDCGDLAAYSRRDKRTEAAAEAAGLFDTLKKMGGGALRGAAHEGLRAIMGGTDARGQFGIANQRY